MRSDRISDADTLIKEVREYPMTSDDDQQDVLSFIWQSVGRYSPARAIKVEPYFRWFDLWIGLYISTENRSIYVGLLPTMGLKIVFSRRLVVRLAYLRCKTLHGLQVEPVPFTPRSQWGRCPVCNKNRFWWDWS